MVDFSLSDEAEELRYWATVLINVLEINKNFQLTDRDGWLIDAHSLTKKSTVHTLSILDLIEGTKPKISSLKSNIYFLDYSSIFTITRSVFECYLVLSYLYLDPHVGIRIKKLRHKIWHASSLSLRQKHKGNSKEGIIVLKNERSSFLKLRREILNSKSLIKIDLKQIKQLRGKRPFEWKPQMGWKQLASQSLISVEFWNDVYNLLSADVHSNAVITFTYSHEMPNKMQRQNTQTAISLLNTIIPALVYGYSSIFPLTKSYIINDDLLSSKINIATGVLKSYGNK